MFYVLRQDIYQADGHCISIQANARSESLFIKFLVAFCTEAETGRLSL